MAPVAIGIDAGSTTTKVVLIDARGRVAFKHYANNHGNAIQADFFFKKAVIRERFEA